MFQIVERLTPEHIKQLHELYRQEWWSHARTSQETKRCVDGSQLCLGALDGHDRLCGFARVLTDYTFKAFIFDLIVARDQREKGMGKQLVNTIVEHPKLWRVQHFELYCLPEMQSFYCSLNFSSEVGGVRLMRHSAKLLMD